MGVNILQHPMSNLISTANEANIAYTIIPDSKHLCTTNNTLEVVPIINIYNELLQNMQ